MVRFIMLSSGLSFVCAGHYTRWERRARAQSERNATCAVAGALPFLTLRRTHEKWRIAWPGQHRRMHLAGAFCRVHDSTSACFNVETMIRGAGRRVTGHSALCHHDSLAISLMRAAVITFCDNLRSSFSALSWVTPMYHVSAFRVEPHLWRQNQ